MVLSLPIFASRYFAFLEDLYGFQRVHSDERVVRWENSKVFVQVLYDVDRSFEVGLEIGQIQSNESAMGPPFSLAEVLRTAGPPTAKRPFFQASTEERLKLSVDEIANLTSQYGVMFLRNDPGAFASLLQQRHVDSAAYQAKNELQRIRAAVDAAWNNQDYPQVVRLYEGHTDDLTPTETKRYEIALKRTK